MRVGTVILTVLLLSSSLAAPVSASHNGGLDLAQVLDITSNPVTDHDRYQEVNRWVRNHSVPETAEEQVNSYLNRAQDNDRSSDTNVQLPNSKSISSGTTVTGYMFDRRNETAELTIKVDSTRTVTIQDVSPFYDDSQTGFSFRTERLKAGEHYLEVEAGIANGGQGIAVVDNQEATGKLIDNGIRGNQINLGKYSIGSDYISMVLGSVMVLAFFLLLIIVSELIPFSIRRL